MEFHFTIERAVVGMIKTTRCLLYWADTICKRLSNKLFNYILNLTSKKIRLT
jgi:hypothetical protein